MPAALDALHTEGTVRVPVHGGGKLEHRAAAGLGAPPVTALFPVRGANRPVPGAKLDGRRHGVNPDESADGTEITAEAPPLVKDPDGDRQAREEDDDPGRHRRRPDHSELLVRPRQEDEHPRRPPDVPERLGEAADRRRDPRRPLVERAQWTGETPAPPPVRPWPSG